MKVSGIKVGSAHPALSLLRSSLRSGDTRADRNDVQTRGSLCWRYGPRGARSLPGTRWRGPYRGRGDAVRAGDEVARSLPGARW